MEQMLIMQVKICGITNSDDARMAEEAGADLVGLIFVERSKRFLPVDRAQVVLVALSGRAEAVGLFQNHPSDHVAELVSRVGLQVVQLHGDETPEYVNDLLIRLPHCRIIKAFSVTGSESVSAMREYYRAIVKKDSILGVLLEAPGGGGTGIACAWQQTAQALSALRNELPRIFLAGGLTVENVSEGIRVLQPDGVDVSSGVESEPGKKDMQKVREFIRLAKGAQK